MEIPILNVLIDIYLVATKFVCFECFEWNVVREGSIEAFKWKQNKIEFLHIVIWEFTYDFMGKTFSKVSNYKTQLPEYVKLL